MLSAKTRMQKRARVYSCGEGAAQQGSSSRSAPLRSLRNCLMQAMRAARVLAAPARVRQASAATSRALHARALFVAPASQGLRANVRPYNALPLLNSASPFALVARRAAHTAATRRIADTAAARHAPYAATSFFGGAPLAGAARRALHVLARPATARLAPPRPTLVLAPAARHESTMKRRKKMMNKHKVRKRRRAARMKSAARRD